MKFKMLVFAALLGGVVSTRATTENLAADTNANPETAMTALFGNPAVVKAKNFEIKRNDLDQVVDGARANAAAAGQRLPADFAASVLNQLITIQVLLQTATPADRVEGQHEADLQYTNLLKRFESPEAFERQLTAVGMTVADLRAKAVQEATAKAALKRELNVVVTDQEAQDYYDKHSADFEQPELVHARHILLMTIDPSTRQPLSTNTIAAKRKQIEELRKRLLAGEDFATLAKEYSEDPGSKENGGELPEFSRGEMVPEFEAAAFSLPTNQVSDVVTTAYGFHLIKVLDRTPAKKIEFAKAEEGIKNGLIRLKIAKLAPDYVKKLRAEQQVEIVDPQLKDMETQFLASQAAAAAAMDTTSTNSTAP